jgi:hypothetical protein
MVVFLLDFLSESQHTAAEHFWQSGFQMPFLIVIVKRMFTSALFVSKTEIAYIRFVMGVCLNGPFYVNESSNMEINGGVDFVKLIQHMFTAFCIG